MQLAANPQPISREGDGLAGTLPGDKFSRLYAEGYSSPRGVTAPVFAPPLQPVLIGLAGAPAAPGAPTPGAPEAPTVGTGVVAGLPRRPDDGVSAGGDSAGGGTIGAPIPEAILVQGAAVESDAPATAVRFDWGRAIFVSILGTLILSGFVALAEKRRREK